MSNEGGKSIDVGTEFDLDEISFLDGSWVFEEGGIVGTDLVGGDAGGEGDALEDGFFVVDFGEFFVDLEIGEEAEFEDFGADRDFFEEFGEDV